MEGYGAVLHQEYAKHIAKFFSQKSELCETQYQNFYTNQNFCL